MSRSSEDHSSVAELHRLRGLRWRRAGRALLVLMVGAGLGAGALQAVTISSTVREDNGATSNGQDGNQNVYSSPVAGPGVLTTAGGYDFTATSYLTLTNITSITVTLTMQDGNSVSGDFDFDHLGLSLDGTATGLVLNGFRGNGLQDTFTFTGTPANAATILASLKADGKLVGTVTTDNAKDTVTSPNEIYFGNDAATQTTTLSITGNVPEPATWTFCGLAFVVFAAMRCRRSSRA